jgi:predicted HTH domain antitoxin
MTEETSIPIKVVKIFFLKSILQCRYIIAQYFRVDMFYGNLHSVSLAIISKMTSKSLVSVVTNLELNTMTQVRSDLNLDNWFYVRRSLVLADLLNYSINEPFRFKLEEQLMMYRKKKWSDWGGTLFENLGKAYVMCKLCGESILLMSLSKHTQYCFSSYETRQRVEIIDKQLWEFANMLRLEIKKGKFNVLSLYNKINKRLKNRRAKEGLILRKKDNRNSGMAPFSLDTILMSEFRNKSFMIDYYPYYPKSLLEMNKLANYYDELRDFKKKSIFVPSVVPKSIKSDFDFEADFDIHAALSVNMKPFTFASMDPIRSNRLVDISCTSIHPRMTINRFKESLSKDNIKLYDKSLPKFGLFAALGIIPKLKDNSAKSASEFNEFFGQASNFMKIRRIQKALVTIGRVVKKAAEFRVEDFRLKERLKKNIVVLRDLNLEDFEFDLQRILDLVNQKITYLCIFESKVQGRVQSFGPGKFRQKFKSEDFDIDKVEVQMNYGTSKQRIKSLRENIQQSAKKIVDLAGPMAKLLKRIKNPFERYNDVELKPDVLIINLLKSEFSKVPELSNGVNEPFNIRSQTVINSSDLAAFRLSLLSSLYSGSKGDIAEKGQNYIEELADQLFFSEDEESKGKCWKSNNAVDRLGDMASYNFIKILGKGAYGVVWLVRRTLTGDLYAMKITDFGDKVN